MLLSTVPRDEFAASHNNLFKSSFTSSKRTFPIRNACEILSSLYNFSKFKIPYTIEIINKHGGVAVLAHPGNNLKGKFEVFDEMVKVGIQGVEAFSNYHTKETCEYFYNKGKEHNLLITCGSDYHGKTKPAIELGETRCFINEHDIEAQLKEYKLI